jgi:hypothetical protein
VFPVNVTGPALLLRIARQMERGALFQGVVAHRVILTSMACARWIANKQIYLLTGPALPSTALPRVVPLVLLPVLATQAVNNGPLLYADPMDSGAPLLASLQQSVAVLPTKLGQISATVGAVVLRARRGTAADV